MSKDTREEGHSGVLLVNVGSPDAPKKGAIRAFLKRFLSDPRVMDLPFLPRWLILNLFILPFRPGKILEKYRHAWDTDNFPLVKHGYALTRKVAHLLGDTYLVEFATRYGTPSIESALEKTRRAGVSHLVIIPLFPQYSSATTGSILETVYKIVGSWSFIPNLSTLSYFYNSPEYIEACVEKGRTYWNQNPDFVLFSFHGIPERHLLKSDISKSHCLRVDNCCETISELNRGCYRAQCHQTANSVAEALRIPKTRMSISFQSRMGKANWTQPYTTDSIAELARNGVKRLLVFSLSFVADCLETTDEILIQERENFLENGGEELWLVPALNADDQWAKAIVTIIGKLKMGTINPDLEGG